MQVKTDKAIEFAEDFKTKAQRTAAELGFRAGQEFQLNDDIECTALFIKRLCILYKIADPKTDKDGNPIAPTLADMELKANKIVEQFKKEMDAI